MKFITAFLTMLMHGTMHDSRNYYTKVSKVSRGRVPGNRGAPSAKLQRVFAEKMATKRGKRTNYEFKV